MAGYAGYSKSNNALQAEANGLLPLSKITGAPKWSIKIAANLIGAEEWHHTSKMYNRTDYYNVEKIVSCAKDLAKRYGKDAADKIENLRYKRRVTRVVYNATTKQKSRCIVYVEGKSTGKDRREIVAAMNHNITLANYNEVCKSFINK